MIKINSLQRNSNFAHQQIRRRIATAALALIWLAPATVPSQATGTPSINSIGPGDEADIQRILRYFSNLGTLTARFHQFSSNGSSAQGRLYLSRPGRLRIEYEPPTPILIIADGKRLFHYDTELNSVSGFGLDETPAAVLLGEKLDLENGDWIPVAFERGPGSLRLTLADRDDIERGQVTLVFSDQPLALKKWRIRDAQEVETTVALSEIRRGVPIDDKLFIMENPQALTNPLIR